MRKRVTSAVVALFTWLASMPVLAQTTAGRPEYWHGGWDWGWGHMIFGSLMMILFWGGIIVAIVVAARWRGGSAHDTTPTASRNKALDILQARFARGEIDKGEFEERKHLLAD